MHNAPNIFRGNLSLYHRGCCIFLTELAQESWRDLAAVFIYFFYLEFLKNLRRSPLRVSPNQGPARRPMRDRLEEHIDHLNIREEAAGIVWVNPSSKCASCHSNEMHQRIIHTHVNVSSKAYVYDETIYNFCARARFAGCTYLRHIILALSTV
jgi:hypothetical protein